MNPTQNMACLIAAYEAAAGLPDSERITRTDGTWRPGVTEQQAASLYWQAQALLTPETNLLSISREAPIDQMRDSLLARDLIVGDTVLFAATEPYAGPGDFTLRAGVIQSIDPERKTCSVQGRFFPMDDVMYWGGMIWTCMRLTMASPVSSLCWGNTLRWQSGICVKQRPGGTPNAGSLQLHQRFRKTRCRRWEA